MLIAGGNPVCVAEATSSSEITFSPAPARYMPGPSILTLMKVLLPVSATKLHDPCGLVTLTNGLSASVGGSPE